jgi:hypothetical protein
MVDKMEDRLDNMDNMVDNNILEDKSRSLIIPLKIRQEKDS